MNKEQFSTQWQQLKTYILEKWNRLNEDDLRQISGRYDQFIEKVQEKYGISREEIEEQFRSWNPNLKSIRETSELPKREREIESGEKESTLGKWLLAAGIPLLLLLGYMAMHETPRTPETTIQSPSSVNLEATLAPTGANRDITLTQTIRNNLTGNTQLRDIRVESNNGIITITGTVKSQEEKALATRIAERTAGVLEVNNKLEVKP